MCNKHMKMKLTWKIFVGWLLVLRVDGKGEGGFPWVKIERRITLVQKYRHWNLIHQDCPPPVSLWSVHFLISLLPITVTLLFTTMCAWECLAVTSLVVQWLRTCRPVQGTRVQSLVWEDSTCHKATKPTHHRACLTQSLCSATGEATAMRSPCAITRESPRTAVKTQSRQKEMIKLNLRKSGWPAQAVLVAQGTVLVAQGRTLCRPFIWGLPWTAPGDPRPARSAGNALPRLWNLPSDWCQDS